MSGADPIEIFRVEARELLEQIEQDLLDLTHSLGNRELIDAVFRGLHTLKGSGSMFGFTALADFTHHCESAFDRVRKGEAAATPELVSLVLAAKDHMRALAENEPTAPGAGEALLAQLHKIVANATGAAAKETPGAKAWRIAMALPANAFVNGCNPLALLDELRELGECQVIARADAAPTLEALAPMECRLAWDVLLTTDKPRSAIEEVFIFVVDDMKLEIAEEGAAAAAPAAEAVSAAPAQDASPAAKAAKSGETVRVPAERLDELMDRVGELVIAQSRLKQVAAVSGELNLRSVAEEIERLASELRDTMMMVRMTPIGQVFGRFRRLVHDLARETGKPIELVTEGETTELDKTVIERLADPLVHLIRNSADHGLETAEERRAAGKPDTGTITLSAKQAGAEVILTVSDDGRGINRDRVRAKAETNGLIAPGAILSDAELLKLIFQPGFSTAESVTNLSGRGVGMDVVKRTIEALHGSFEVESALGHGSEVSLRIPLTLAIIDGLLVRVGEGRYVIPLAAVEECVELSGEQDSRSRGRNLLTIRDQLVPFVRLRELFDTGTEPDAFQKIVVVSAGQERIGLVVDQIIGDHQTVIKSLSSFHRDVGTFSGATILGDGGVALILDVVQVVKAGQPADLAMAS